jgi:hypothetical protein
MKFLLIAMLFMVPQAEEKEKEESKQEEPKPEMDPEKEGHSHGEDEWKRRQTNAHGDDPKLCSIWGYCFPSGHDPSSWREYLPESVTLHACPKIAVCHPEDNKEHAELCFNEDGSGRARDHCDQSCREQCCFCCGSP